MFLVYDVIQCTCNKLIHYLYMYNINYMYIHLHVHDTLSLLIYYRNNSDCLVYIGLDLVTIMLEYGRWSLGKVIPLLQDRICHHLLMVCYVTIEAIIINVHVLEMYIIKEHEHVKLHTNLPYRHITYILLW